jgi:hypothetical protein
MKKRIRHRSRKCFFEKSENGKISEVETMRFLEIMANVKTDGKGRKVAIITGWALCHFN